LDEMEAVVVQKPFTIGYQSVHLLNRYLDGREIPYNHFTGSGVLDPDNVLRSEPQ
jgi:ribose transport system substrate-binding protein